MIVLTLNLPPLSPYYDSSVICDVDRNNEVEDAQLVHQKEEFQSFNHICSIDIEKSTHEDVNSIIIHELGHIRPHSYHFSTLCLDSDILMEPMKKCKEEEQYVYILEFVVLKSENYIPHLRAKSKMQHLLCGSIVFIPPHLEHSRKIISNLRVQFIS